MSSPPGDGWLRIETAPTDGTPIEVWAPGIQELEPVQCLCVYHPDVGFCVDELREPTHWRHADPSLLNRQIFWP
jgi:hypothetical protein